MDETTAGPGKPFGEGVNASLTSLLELGEKEGFTTKNLDGFAGHIEWGRAMTLSAYFAMLTSCRREMGGRVIHFQLKSATDGFMQGAPLMTKYDNGGILRAENRERHEFAPVQASQNDYRNR